MADIDSWAAAIQSGDRAALARAITRVESRREEDLQTGQQLIEACLKIKSNSYRIGITGVPGAGKSTFIEQLGMRYIAAGHRVAVLAVDPSSSITKGSILGDKTRMQELSRADAAFIRPSPAGDSLGGVARKTRETITLCEAAGYDIILVETVGVGQSETAVHGMVDFFLLLKISGAGDELQGIKRGVVELADALVINKADGENMAAARTAQTTFKKALHLYPPKPNGWDPKVLLCSSLEGSGFDEIEALLSRYAVENRTSGSWNKKRTEQNIAWMQNTLDSGMQRIFQESSVIREEYQRLQEQVAQGNLSPFRAAEMLLKKITFEAK
ncbi:methylmalonyl-CoA mutase metallochaperone MeaB [Robiginitalea myxolifaciens]|uniref:Methylmalonyl-CoA mutase metallochaperone MeaB n=1 Tax=Robiginitalea myxolifaciens TaxID=400055 RepID=A0A1I6H7V1_9FLAO|nr:methylmalonyl Co-A mutase-associated GTPase MeaB [Robiginitalea myxolifaciens]SFR50438.1 methylmalonyl-CoA mutase metallochaperone MeaB [Robiginitalea myxolifaciens]